MAVRKPLVIVNGLIQQLQPGDTITAVETGQVSLQATATLIPGEAVYPDGSGTVDKARANATGTSKAVGLAAEGISSSASGMIQTNGILTLTTTEWDAVTGQTGGLTPGAYYFLSAATAGALTTTAPSTTGHSVLPIGQAISDVSMNICIEKPILL